MATPFIALGHGNGFPFCLETRELSLDGYDPSDNAGFFYSGNQLTLAQAMNAYWNVESVSFRNAVWPQTSIEPRDLICDPDLRVGFQRDVDDLSEGLWVYEASISRPFYYLVNGQKYLNHGISFTWYAVPETGGLGVEVSVEYTSGVTILWNNPYECGPLGQSYEYVATATDVIIDGLPFIRVVTKYHFDVDGYEGKTCVPPNYYPSLPTEIPNLTFHTY